MEQHHENGKKVFKEENDATRTPQDDSIQGGTNDATKLSSAFEKLEATDAGRPAANAIKEHGTMIQFGETEGAIAQFDPSTNEITIANGSKESGSAVLATHLAHEGTHVGWDKPHRLDSFEEFAEDYVEEEYQAFKAESEVWNAVKGKETDKTCDDVSEIIAQGEAEAKRIIRQIYLDDIRQSWLWHRSKPS